MAFSGFKCIIADGQVAKLLSKLLRPQSCWIFSIVAIVNMHHAVSAAGQTTPQSPGLESKRRRSGRKEICRAWEKWGRRKQSVGGRREWTQESRRIQRGKQRIDRERERESEIFSERIGNV